MELKYKTLVGSLQLLASSYEQQKRFLPKFVSVKDEVVALFGDAFLLMPDLIEKEFFSTKSIASIIRCFNWMEIAIRNENPLDLEYFIENERWQKVRYLAKKALNEMGEPVEFDLNNVDLDN